MRLAALVAVTALGIAAARGVSSEPSARADAAPAPGSGWRAPLDDALGLRLTSAAGVRPAALSTIGRRLWWGGATTASTGETVTIYLSDSFARDASNESVRVGWANFFASLYHGPELSTVAIYVATLDEVNFLCGGEDVVGCYSPSRRILLIPGDVGTANTADVAAHEYGHHLAANRRNDPWPAIDWGTKRWASYANVCARAAAGTAFPGDEGDRYRLNPGEAFAEAYRIVHVQRGGTWANLPLVVDSSFAPDANALAAAQADAQQPWPGQAAATWAGQATTTSPVEWTLQTPLDGTLQATVNGTANAQLELVEPSTRQVLVARAPSLTFTICGHRSLVLRVVPEREGSFEVGIASPSPQTPPAAPPAPPTTPPVVTPRPTVLTRTSALAPRPAKPRAGRQFQLSFAFRYVGPARPAPRAQCTGRIGSAPVRVLRSSAVQRAVCIWQIPRLTAGKVFRGTVRVFVGGATPRSVERTLALEITQ